MNRRGRPRHDDILTPREWQVLDLIEAGLTNEEIAARLDISFGTAKYHVAEIISKLGVATREDAVIAARRSRAPVAPAWPFGGRAALPVLAGGVVVAAALLVSVVALTDVLRDPATPTAEGDFADAAADFQDGDAATTADVLNRAPALLSSFYYELAVSSVEPTAPSGAPRNANARVRVWYKAPDRWRSEYLDPGTGEPASVSVTDGTTEWRYDAEARTYSMEPHDGVIPRPLLGQLTGGSIQGFMDDEKDGPAHYWEVGAHRDVVAGIETVQVLQGCCRSGTLDQRMSEQRFWIDPTYNFLLRLEEKSLGTGGMTLYEVTDVQYNPDLDDALFQFEPPPGATQVAPP